MEEDQTVRAFEKKVMGRKFGPKRIWVKN